MGIIVGLINKAMTISDIIRERYVNEDKAIEHLTYLWDKEERHLKLWWLNHYKEIYGLEFETKFLLRNQR